MHVPAHAAGVAPPRPLMAARPRPRKPRKTRKPADPGQPANLFLACYAATLLATDRLAKLAARRAVLPRRWVYDDEDALQDARLAHWDALHRWNGDQRALASYLLVASGRGIARSSYRLAAIASLPAPAAGVKPDPIGVARAAGIAEVPLDLPVGSADGGDATDLHESVSGRRVLSTEDGAERVAFWRAAIGRAIPGPERDFIAGLHDGLTVTRAAQVSRLSRRRVAVLLARIAPVLARWR